MGHDAHQSRVKNQHFSDIYAGLITVTLECFRVFLYCECFTLYIEIGGGVISESTAFNSKVIFYFCIYFIDSYHDLIEPHVVEIDGETGTLPKIENKRRRRKKKCALHKSSSSANISTQIDRRASEYMPSLLDSGRSEIESVSMRRASASELGKWWNVSNGAVTEEEGGLVHQHSVPDPQITRHQGLNSHNQCQEVLSVMPNGSSYASSALETESPPEKEITDLSQEAEKEEVIFRTNEKSHENVPILQQGNGSVASSGLSSKVQCLSSPLFMKTAMSARSNRIGNSVEQSPQERLESDNWEWYSSHHVASKSSQSSLSPTSSSTTLHNGSEHSPNCHFESEDLYRTSKSRGTQGLGGSRRNNIKKMSGSSGLKKMVKKFF
jgi:hypothetical protein